MTTGGEDALGGLRHELAELRARLAESEETLHAIRSGDVDAITVSTPDGEQIYSLRGADLPYREMIEAMSEGAVNITPDGKVLYCNQCFARMTRAELQTITGSSLLDYFVERDRARIAVALRDTGSGSERVRAHLRTMDGSLVPVNVATHVIANNEAVQSIVIVTSDLTQVVVAEEATTKINLRMEQANRALQMLNLCNTIVIHATDEQRMLTDVCHVLVDAGGYRLAWVGYAEHDPAKSVRAVAWADSSEDCMRTIQVSWGDDERGRGPTGTTIRSGRMTVVHDTETDPTYGPWREAARRNGLRSSVTVPLRVEAVVLGALTVCSGQPHAFDAQEAELLRQLADDISYCIANLRRETKLGETRTFLDNILQSSTKYSIIGEDLERRIQFWNEGARRNYGYTADEVIGRSMDILYAPEERASGMYARLIEAAQTRGFAEAEIERVRKDGSQFPASVVVTRRDDEAGHPIGYVVVSSDITEKRQAEQALQSREQALRLETDKLRSILDSMAEAVVVADRNGNIVEFNRAACGMHGVAALDGRLDTWVNGSGLLQPDAAAPLGEAQNPLVRALRGENTDGAEIYLRRPDGSGAHAEITGRPVRTADGSVWGGVAVLSDITERKRAEAEREESAAVFRTLTDAMPQLVWMCTPDGLSSYFNQQWVDYTGLTLAESYGRGWSKPFHPDDRQAATQAWDHATGSGAAYRNESRLRAADGSYRWFLMKGTPLRDGAGRIMKWFGTCTDIDELKSAEGQLRSASQYARSLIEASLDPLVTISPDGKVTDVNHGTELITGRSRGSLIDTDFAIYFTEPDKARAGYKQVFRKGFLIDYPLAIRHIAGTVTEVFCNASLYRDANGEVAGVFLAARDLSRLPQVDARAASWRRGTLWRTALYVVAAVVCSVGISLGSLELRNWLQRQQDQASILRTVASNSRMRSLLSGVIPNPARVRVGIVRNQPGTDIALSYATTYGVAAPNHALGVLGVDRPVALLSNELGALTAGECSHSTQQRYDETLRLSDIITCPITGANHRMLGFLFVSWDHGDPVPAQFDQAMAEAKLAASDIAAIWSGGRP